MKKIPFLAYIFLFLIIKDINHLHYVFYLFIKIKSIDTKIKVIGGKNLVT